MTILTAWVYTVISPVSVSATPLTVISNSNAEPGESRRVWTARGIGVSEGLVIESVAIAPEQAGSFDVVRRVNSEYVVDGSSFVLSAGLPFKAVENRVLWHSKLPLPDGSWGFYETTGIPIGRAELPISPLWPGFVLNLAFYACGFGLVGLAIQRHRARARSTQPFGAAQPGPNP
jgi:hypothetical protein